MGRSRSRSDDETDRLIRDFRERFPVDDRALDFLQKSPPEVVSTVVSEFRPKRTGEKDYSALVTNFVRQVRDRLERQGRLGRKDNRRQDSPSPDKSRSSSSPVRKKKKKRRSGSSSPRRGRKKRRSSSGESQSRKASRSSSRSRRRAPPPRPQLRSGAVPTQDDLDDFRDRYPMDHRAFDHLCAAPPEVQQAVITQFRPRREGESDYSALLSSFVRAVHTRHEQRKPDGRPGNQEGDRPPPDDETALADFRMRYPMDERAYSVLERASPGVRATVISDFRPRREGEEDYSALVMSFARSVQSRVGVRRGGSRSRSRSRSGKRRQREHSESSSRG